jgi:paraquat-inducible protein B
MAEDSPLIASIMQVLEESRRTFRSLRGLSDQLDRHPESLLRGAPQDPTPEFPAQPAHSPQEKR